MTMTEDIEMEDEEEVINPIPPPILGEPAEVEVGVVGQLEDEAKRRKERLKALKQKLLGGKGVEEGEDDNHEDGKKGHGILPKPIFRSYNPTHDKFQDAAVPKAKAIDIEPQIADTLEHAVVKPIVEDVDLTSLAPRKPDWDLKRDVAPKLTKLERRTQKAIAELILERLKNNQQNLAAAVEFAANPTVDDGDD